MYIKYIYIYFFFGGGGSVFPNKVLGHPAFFLGEASPARGLATFQSQTLGTGSGLNRNHEFHLTMECPPMKPVKPEGLKLSQNPWVFSASWVSIGFEHFL